MTSINTVSSEAASPETFIPRKNLSRTLSYRAHLKAAYYGSIAGAVLSVLAGSYYLVDQLSSGLIFDLIGLAILLGALPAFLLFQAFVGMRPYAFTTVHLTPAGLRVVRPWDSAEVAFKDIAAIKVQHVPYMGGRFSLRMPDGREFFFTVALERSEYVLENLLQARPDLLPADDFLRFRRTALASDHSWARLVDRFRVNWLQLALLYVALPLGAFLAALPSYLTAGSEGEDLLPALFSGFFSVAALNFTVGLGVWAVADLFLIWMGGEKILRDPSALRRDLPLEKKVYRYSAFAHVVLVLGILAYVVLLSDTVSPATF